ncbi:unnamed protein product, partial [Mesorhabditis spiculigera]
MNFAQILEHTKRILPEKDGFEVYPFRLGSYNSQVGPEFKLPYEDNAAGFLVLSTPDMFDVAFQNWIKVQHELHGSFEDLQEMVANPIADFIKSRVDDLCEKFNGMNFEVFHDHSLHPNRKPKIVMCTCGHVSGAAYYYHPTNFISNDWPNVKDMGPNLKFIGVSLHPIYGGHFAFRFTVLFKDVVVPDGFVEPKPMKIALSDEEAREAMDLFNYNWRDSRFRDVGQPKKRYSECQMNYFGRPPADRWDIIREWCEEEVVKA